MVFHWSLSDSKSSKVSRTLLSIQTVLKNAVVLMVSTHPPTSKSSSPFNSPLVTVPNAPITLGIIVTFIFHSSFFILQQGLGTYPSFHILSVLFCGQPVQQSRQFCKFPFFVVVDYYKVWSSGRDYGIRLYVKVPKEFLCVILQIIIIMYPLRVFPVSIS